MGAALSSLLKVSACFSRRVCHRIICFSLDSWFWRAFGWIFLLQVVLSTDCHRHHHHWQSSKKMLGVRLGVDHWADVSHLILTWPYRVGSCVLTLIMAIRQHWDRTAPTIALPCSDKHTRIEFSLRTELWGHRAGVCGCLSHTWLLICIHGLPQGRGGSWEFGFGFVHSRHGNTGSCVSSASLFWGLVGVAASPKFVQNASLERGFLVSENKIQPSKLEDQIGFY